MNKTKKFLHSELAGVVIYSPDIHVDSRGATTEWFSSQNLPPDFIDFRLNQLLSVRNEENVIRGVHFSSSENVQLKIVKCTYGLILDIVVDLREESPTFGRYESLLLNSDEEKTLFIPHGFGHAYQVLSSSATVQYALQTNFDFENEYVIDPFDDYLSLPWRGENHILSSRDQGGADFKTFFGLI